MRRVIMLASLLLASQTVEAQQRRVRIGIIGHPGPVAVDSLATTVTINGSPGATFRALAQVFAELKIAVDAQDSTRGVIGVTSLARMRTFGNTRISRYLNCGSGMTGLNADNWRVYVTALAFVEKGDSTTSTLRLAMVGGAQDVAGSSTEPVACGTTGVFEALVAERVKQRVASPIE
jgi:hypothetical protein